MARTVLCGRCPLLQIGYFVHVPLRPRGVEVSYKQKHALSVTSLFALIVMAWVGTPPRVVADEGQAKSLMKAMTDYVASQQTISFDYDSNLEVVTNEQQKLAVAASGTVSLARPDKIRASRSGGFADVETTFDGRTLNILGKNVNAYLQVESPGSIDQLIDTLRKKYDRPLPAADLLLTNAYDELMADVVNVKDLGSGVIGGRECDHLAFRSKEVDWQIWIAHGDRPYPCRYVITSKRLTDGPQYSIQITNWKTGGDVAKSDYRFAAPAGARRVDVNELSKLKGMGELPSNFVLGDTR